MKNFKMIPDIEIKSKISKIILNSFMAFSCIIVILSCIGIYFGWIPNNKTDRDGLFGWSIICILLNIISIKSKVYIIPFTIIMLLYLIVVNFLPI